MARKDISDTLICEIVRDMPRTAWDSPVTPSPDLPELLAERTGEPDKVCRAAIERALDHRVIECGVSIRRPWLTESGEALLQERESIKQNILKAVFTPLR